MSNRKLKQDDPVFIFIDQLIKAAIKAHIALEMEWIVDKEYFENIWEAQQLSDAVAKQYGLQLSDAKVKVELEDKEDPESLICCCVKFDALDNLLEILNAHGMKPQIEVQVNNSSVGSSCATILNEDDIDNDINPLSVWKIKPALNDGLIEKLNHNFGSLIGSI